MKEKRSSFQVQIIRTESILSKSIRLGAKLRLTDEAHDTRPLTILGSRDNRSSSPVAHGPKFLIRLFRARLRWRHQSWPAQVPHLSRQDEGVPRPTGAIQNAHRPTAFFESRSNPI